MQGDSLPMIGKMRLRIMNNDDAEQQGSVSGEDHQECRMH